MQAITVNHFFSTAVKIKRSEQVCLCTVKRSAQNVELILLTTIIIMVGTMKMTSNLPTTVLGECSKLFSRTI